MNARRLGRPNAVWDVAAEIWEYAHHAPIPTNRRSLLTDLTKRTVKLRLR
jgi:hypothetical protein